MSANSSSLPCLSRHDRRRSLTLQIFVGTDDINGHDSSVPARSVAYKGTRVPAASAMESEVRRARRRERTSGFEQRDLVHLLGLVCPDFPEEMIGWVSH